MVFAFALLLTTISDSKLTEATRFVDGTRLEAQEGVWAYTHAGDPGGDEFLRIWGANGTATPEGGDGEDWSYGYLKWDLSSVDVSAVNSAKLVVYNIAPPGFPEAAIKAAPLQARQLVGSFSAAGWEYSQALKVKPGLASTVFGTGILTSPYLKTDKSKPVEIGIDLIKGPGHFLDALRAAKAAPDHTLYLALTSAIDPNSEGGPSDKSGLYKLYSAAAKAGHHPALVLN